MSIKYSTKPYRIERQDCQALIVDVQSRLAPHIADHERLVEKICILIKGLQALAIPIMLNEQYPKGLGQTLPAITQCLTQPMSLDINTIGQTPTSQGNVAIEVFEKATFSVCDTPHSWNHIASQNRNSVIICGVETHVCVLQTVLDLLDNGMQPIVIADAVGSRDTYDKKIAIRRMRHAGAVVTTTEAILFELCRSSQDPAFKTISSLVK